MTNPEHFLVGRDGTSLHARQLVQVAEHHVDVGRPVPGGHALQHAQGKDVLLQRQVALGHLHLEVWKIVQRINIISKAMS